MCTEKGITISELERTVGLGNGSIARWGENMPSVDRVKRVADFFCVTVDDLLTDDKQSEESG